MRNNPIAFRPTDETKLVLARIPKGGRSIHINSCIMAMDSAMKKCSLTHPRQVKK